MFFPLMLWDVGVLLFFVTSIVVLNFKVQETPYAGVLILIFSAYTVSVGKKISQSTMDMVNSKNDLQRTAVAAKKAHQAKSDFLAVMSHEIRTPLGGIMGMIDFLKETSLTQEQKKYLDTISDCSGTLIRTLNDVLDISKMEAGKFSVSKINFDLYDLLQNAKQIVERAAEKKGIEVRLAINSGTPGIIYSDPDRLRQVINNLLNNAIKFTSEGGRFSECFI